MTRWPFTNEQVAKLITVGGNLTLSAAASVIRVYTELLAFASRATVASEPLWTTGADGDLDVATRGAGVGRGAKAGRGTGAGRAGPATGSDQKLDHVSAIYGEDGMISLTEDRPMASICAPVRAPPPQLPSQDPSTELETGSG